MKTTNSFWFVIIIVGMLIIARFDLMAQIELKGRVVVEQSRTAVEGANVLLEGTGLSTNTDADGRFQFSISKIGKYKLNITSQGFITNILDIDINEKSEIYIGDIELSFDFINISLEDLMNIKVKVSSTIPTSIYDSPSSVTVVDRATIERYNFLSIADAVRIVSGIEILQSNLDRNIPTIRGILQNYYANKILIMINNIPTWQPIYGNGTLDRIAINDVEKIEILKGPASVLYGTNAYNGVINIILKEITSTKLITRINAGYPGYSSTSVNLSMINDDIKLSISGNTLFENRKPYLVIGANDSINYGNQYYYGKETTYYFNEEYKQYSLNISGQYKNHTLFFNTFNNTFTYPGVNISYATGGNLPFTDLGSLLGYNYNNQITSKLNLFLALNYDYLYRKWESNPDRTKSLQLSAQRINSILKLNYRLSETFDFEFGTDFLNGVSFGHHELSELKDTVIRHNMKKDQEIIEWSLFGQTNYKISNLTFLVGTRYTGNKVFGSNISSRIATVWKPDSVNSFKLMFGQSFRTPTMLELYFDHPTVIGNPKLNPETNETFELSYLTGRIKNTFIQLTGFRSTFQNLIQRVRPDNSKPAEYRNVSAFNGWGIEIETKYTNSRVFNAFMNYTYLKGIGSDAYSNYRFVPAHSMKLGFSKNINDFTFSGDCYTYSETEGLISKIPQQFMANMHVAYSHFIDKNLKLTHTISLLNITKSEMLIPEYIRQRNNINSIPTSAYGSRILYTLIVEY